MTASLRLTAALLVLVWAGCDMFSPRTPDPPRDDAGTYIQPSTPEDVIENVRSAVAEMNARNYRRSFDPDLRFEPTESAGARDPSLWTGWGTQEEESYFRSMAESARLTANNELRLSDVEQTAGASRFDVDASYTLVVNHRQGDLSETLRGRLVWAIEQGQDGLWRITRWTDRSAGDAASWSDLKAAFIK